MVEIALIFLGLAALIGLLFAFGAWLKERA